MHENAGFIIKTAYKCTKRANYVTNSLDNIKTYTFI